MCSYAVLYAVSVDFVHLCILNLDKLRACHRVMAAVIQFGNVHSCWQEVVISPQLVSD